MYLTIIYCKKSEIFKLLDSMLARLSGIQYSSF